MGTRIRRLTDESATGLCISSILVYADTTRPIKTGSRFFPRLMASFPGRFCGTLLSPYLLFPHPDMPSIFNTFGFCTNAALSKKNYFNEECLEFRLLATQMCDDLEMAEYVRTENYRFKKYWLLAKKAQLKEKTDKMKERINQFIFSSKDSSENTNPDVNIPGF